MHRGSCNAGCQAIAIRGLAAHFKTVCVDMIVEDLGAERDLSLVDGGGQRANCLAWRWPAVATNTIRVLINLRVLQGQLPGSCNNERLFDRFATGKIGILV